MRENGEGRKKAWFGSTYGITEAMERENMGKKGGGRKKTKEGEISTYIEKVEHVNKIK